ncbi:MAG: hypothetical protein IGS48_23255 [Oscillatoriales cyanobacterium C42_A2020_001]|nr:hypothetical protein [Leptolyngbyaceae cyanobacterium C42_A2020_001]
MASRSQPDHTQPSDRKPIAQPPLPPPPNPKYQQPSVSEPQPHAQTADGQNNLSIGATTPYDVHIEGPLTYFSYYFEDLGTSSSPVENVQSSSRSKLQIGLIGAGAVATTVVSGLIIGDALKPAEPSKNTQETDSAKQQNAAKNLPRPTSTSPERLSTERSLPQVKPQSSIKPRSQSSSGRTSSLQQLQQIQNLPAPVPIAMPETLALKPATTPNRSGPRLTKVPVQKLQTSQAVNIPRISVEEAAARQAALSPIAQPETLPAGNQPSVEPSVSAPSMPTEAPSTTALPPFTPSSNSSETEQNTLIPNPPTVEVAPSITSQPQTRGAVSENAVSSTAIAPTQPAITSTPSSQVATGTTNQPSSSRPEGIKDYLALPQSTPTKVVNLMPLSQQAAAEVPNQGQIGQFKVRQVNAQDYQKEWMASNKTIEDPAIALAYPAYGFIDYQRQLIVVLQDKTQDAPMQSQRLTPPSS